MEYLFSMTPLPRAAAAVERVHLLQATGSHTCVPVFATSITMSCDGARHVILHMIHPCALS